MAEEAPNKASLGELVGNITSDLSTLMRQELQLAKAEVKEEASKAGKAAGMFGGAGFAGYMVVFFLSIALWAALDAAMPSGWAALIVAGVWAVIGAVLFLLARSNARSLNPKPERTIDTLQKVPAAMKGNDS